jgi:hypothetical protein
VHSTRRLCIAPPFCLGFRFRSAWDSGSCSPVGRLAAPCVITRLGSYILDLTVDVQQQRCQDPYISDYTRAVTSCAHIFSTGGAGCRIWQKAAITYRAGTNTRRQSCAASATRIQRPHCPREQQRRGQRGAERRHATTPLQRQNRAHRT